MIAASTGNSRKKVTEIVSLDKKKGLVCPLGEEMTDQWIEEFLFPEKTLEASGRQPLNFDYIHEELARPNVTLSLLHHEAECWALIRFSIRIAVLYVITVDTQISRNRSLDVFRWHFLKNK